MGGMVDGVPWPPSTSWPIWAWCLCGLVHGASVADACGAPMLRRAESRAREDSIEGVLAVRLQAQRRTAANKPGVGFWC